MNKGKNILLIHGFNGIPKIFYYLKKELENYTKELKLTDKIIFTGFLGNKEKEKYILDSYTSCCTFFYILIMSNYYNSFSVFV